MPASLSYDPELRILNVAVSGPVVPAEFDAALTAITTSTAFPPDVDALWDFSDADFRGTRSADLRVMLDTRMARVERGRSLVAIVANSDMAYGMSRIFQALSERGMPQRLTVVRSVNEAERWILDARAKGIR
jgi:hypothetical protein